MKTVTTLIIALILFQLRVGAQRINFSTYVQSENINVTIVDNPLGLNFNTKQRVIVVGDHIPVVIDLMDISTVSIEIDAPLDYDLTVQVTASMGLSLGGLDTGVLVPYQFRIAYNNTGEPSDVQRRMSAVQVPAGFSTITLPIRRRVGGGPPLPPPTPDHAGFSRPRGKAYLYVYGALGPIPNMIPAGEYAGTVNINISYTTNDL